MKFSEKLWGMGRARRGRRRVTRRVYVLADAARASPFTPPAGGPLSAWR